jgi:hypothetical protein
MGIKKTIECELNNRNYFLLSFNFVPQFFFLMIVYDEEKKEKGQTVPKIIDILKHLINNFKENQKKRLAARFAPNTFKKIYKKYIVY